MSKTNLRLVVSVSVLLLLVSAAMPMASIKAAAPPASGIQDGSEDAPRILNARVNGKKLIITGENFEPGARIFVNGQIQKTKNDSENPSSMLIAKKAGKKIKPTDVFSLQVENPGGARSRNFPFFSGPVITFANHGETLSFKPGEMFLLAIDGNLAWALNLDHDNGIIRAVPTLQPMIGTQGLFVAARAGRLALSAKGELLCHFDTPPCDTPGKLFEVTIVVE
jgi:hypothetical protein